MLAHMVFNPFLYLLWWLFILFSDILKVWIESQELNRRNTKAINASPIAVIVLIFTEPDDIESSIAFVFNYRIHFIFTPVLSAIAFSSSALYALTGTSMKSISSSVTPPWN